MQETGADLSPNCPSFETRGSLEKPGLIVAAVIHLPPQLKGITAKGQSRALFQQNRRNSALTGNIMDFRLSG